VRPWVQVLALKKKRREKRHKEWKKNCVLTPPTTGVGKDAGKKEPSYTVGGNVD
jgi:hypothetical protein